MTPIFKKNLFGQKKDMSKFYKLDLANALQMYIIFHKRIHIPREVRN